MWDPTKKNRCTRCDMLSF